MLSDRRRNSADLHIKLLKVLLASPFLACVMVGSASAQKYPGATLDDVPVQRPYTPPPASRGGSAAPLAPRQFAPTPNRPPLPAATQREGDSEARALADRLPLDPATANLEARNPADLPGTIRQLGLRVPNGSRTDMQSRTPSTRELVDALRH